MTQRIAILLALVLVAALALSLPGRSQEAPPSALPVGAIVAWHGAGKAATPPPGWQLCDGSPITDAAFVTAHGKGHKTPDLNATPAFLRGGAKSGTFGGADRHVHPHRHSVAHHHEHAHRHDVPHRHRISVRTTTEGGSGRGGKDALSGTRRHSHDVRGQTDEAPGATTRGANPSRVGPSSATESGPVRGESGPTLPRHFTVRWIIKVR